MLSERGMRVEIGQDQPSQFQQQQAQLKAENLEPSSNRRAIQLKDHVSQPKKVSIFIWILVMVILVAIFTSIFCGLFYVYFIKQNTQKTEASQNNMYRYQETTPVDQKTDKDTTNLLSSKIETNLVADLNKSDKKQQVSTTDKHQKQQTDLAEEQKKQAQQVEETYNDFGIKYNTLSEVPANRRITVTITSCCGRYDLLNQTLFTFFKKSTFPYDSIIIVQDGQLYQELLDVLALYKEHNITVVATGKKVGQIKAIDMIYTWVQTPYIFHFQDDWEFLRKGFIQESMNWLQNDPKLVQVWIQKHGLPFQKDTRKPITDWSISFTPGLKKLADYKYIGTYSGYTRNKSFGTGAGSAQWYLSNYYVKSGKYVVQTETQYTRHIGNNRAGQRWRGKITKNL